MTIDDLRTLMDEFDPAALLPELDSVMGVIEFAVRIAVMAGPIILLVLGLMYLLLAPKEANYHFGYRCFFGMGSVDAWRYTQRLAGIIWGALGLVLTGVMVLITNGYARMETMEILSSALKCILWEAGLAVVSSLFINFIVFTQFNSQGEYRRKKTAARPKQKTR